MAVEITVILDGSAGGMARVVAALKRFGLAFSGHHIESIGEDRSRLTINAEGQASADELRSNLNDIKGVVEVLAIGSAGEPAGAQRESKPPPVQFSGIDDLAERIANDYPKILRYVDSFEEQLTGNKDRAQQLRLLGRRVGANLGAQDTGLHESQTLHEALNQAVVPILDRIAEPEVVGNDLRVRLSIFTRRQINTMDLVFGGEASRCDFMSGMIEGLLASVEKLPSIHVEETSCRTNGDEHCLFRITS